MLRYNWSPRVGVIERGSALSVLMHVRAALSRAKSSKEKLYSTCVPTYTPQFQHQLCSPVTEAAVSESGVSISYVAQFQKQHLQEGTEQLG